MTANALQREASRTKLRQQFGGWLFVAPVLLLNLIVVIIPSIAGLGMAFTDWSGVGSMDFIGLANFEKLLQDQVFFKALSHNLIWTVFFLIVPVALGLLGAYLLSGIRRGQMFFRVAYFIPYVIAAVVNAQLWRFLLNPRVGLLKALADCCGLDFLERGRLWLARPSSVRRGLRGHVALLGVPAGPVPGRDVWRGRRAV